MAPNPTTPLHHALIRNLLDHGACPSNAKLAHDLQLTEPQIESGLNDLAAIHGIVLHPHICEPWIIHPFSITPTLNWIAGPERSWWAPCMWCALGVATLAGGKVEIHTRCAAESEPLTISVVDGHVEGHDDLVVHFAIPPARAWDNVHQHCAMVLPFHSASEIPDWCSRHGLPQGEAVPITKVAALARTWYGHHADPNWKKWTVAEAQQIFHAAGLTSSFWNLGNQSGRF